MWHLLFSDTIIVNLQSFCFYKLTRWSILGSNSMTKSEYSLSLWLLSECLLSSFIQKTNKWTYICVSWAPVGAKNDFVIFMWQFLCGKYLCDAEPCSQKIPWAIIPDPDKWHPRIANLNTQGNAKQINIYLLSSRH